MERAPDDIGGVMTPDVVTVGRSDAVEVALRAMHARDIGSVVVTEDGSPVGVFTERDLTRRVLSDPELLRRSVGDVMSSPVVSTTPSTEVVDAFEVMNDRRIRRLPVVDGDRLVGIVTERDLLRWVGRVARE